MAVVVSANITQDPTGTPVTFVDSSTGVGTLTSRTLVITDANGVVLQTINMGATLTATFPLTKDLYLTFTLIIIDNTGTYVLVKNYLSTIFYQIAFSNAIAVYGCNCKDTQGSIYDKANRFKSAADIFASRGLAPAAQLNIDAANKLIGN
ncbi:MAG: hypothetical protein JWQ09_5869 [Segetibacter sp.]|nr:hypothetical protein [Segetibacter sp.]